MSKTETGAAPRDPDKLSFFRQSGWMLLASTTSGFLMYLVHMVIGKEVFMPRPEYGLFNTLLKVLGLMMIPAIGLQLVFVQQTVAATTPEGKRQLAGTVRGVLAAVLVLWGVMVLWVLIFQEHIATVYKISNPAAIWVTLLTALTALVNSVMMGLLHGKMNFLWLGWASMVNGLGRLLAIVGVVIFFGGDAVGAMVGALVGMAVSVGIAAWHTRDIWLGPSAATDWRAWLKRVVPLSLGLGAASAMVQLDMIAVRRFFTAEEAGYYAAVAMIGWALVFLTAPLTLVMFPRIVQSAARSEKTNVLAQALGVTALLGGCAALACTFLPELPLRIVYDPSYLKVAHLIPLFAWCVLPVTLSNVLVNNLLARRQFGIVVWLVVVALGYWASLWSFHGSFETVIWTLGLFGMLFLGGCMAFTWWGSRRPS